MSKKPEDPKARAEATFKRKEAQAREGAVAMAEYQAEKVAVQKKTAKLRALREAKEAKDAKDAKDAKNAKDAEAAKKGAGKKK